MTEIQRGPEDASMKGQLERLFGFVDQSQGNIGAFFVAIASGEDVGVPDADEHLADFDNVTQRGQLKFDQDIAAVQHQDTLESAGLGFDADVFSGSLCIRDGEKFVQALGTVPETSEILQKGLNSILRHFLHAVAYAYIPTPTELDKNTYEKFSFEPSPKPAPQADSAMFLGVLLNADHVVREFERLEASHHASRNLQALHTAELENMTPEWAVAHHWGLFTPPTTDWGDSHWVQWSEQGHWNVFFEYLEHAQLKAPHNSEFMTLVIGSMLRNVDNLRNGVLEPTERPQIPIETEGEDDNFVFHSSSRALDEEEAHIAAEQDRRYNQMLDDVLRRLSTML